MSRRRSSRKADIPRAGGKGGRRPIFAWRKLRAGLCRLALIAALGATVAGAQEPGTAGPQKPPANAPNITRIPNTPVAPEKPPIPAEEIIRSFAEQEDELAQASRRYAYRKSVRLQEFGPDGKPSGQSEVVTTPATGADGRRYQRATGEPQSTLQFLDLNRDALEGLTQLPAFPLGTAQLSKYQISYEGMEPLDELVTYIFRVKPVQLERTHPYFDGLVWVDNHDLTIVKSYGKWVAETGPWSPADLPFTMYETYREPVDKKYWLPAYSRSDATLATKNGSVAVRLVIRWDQYTPAPPGTSAAPETDAPEPGAPRLHRAAGAPPETSSGTQ